jgi:hypothetical protein
MVFYEIDASQEPSGNESKLPNSFKRDEKKVWNLHFSGQTIDASLGDFS